MVLGACVVDRTAKDVQQAAILADAAQPIDARVETLRISVAQLSDAANAKRAKVSRDARSNTRDGLQRVRGPPRLEWHTDSLRAS
jgi:hypothetical protein